MVLSCAYAHAAHACACPVVSLEVERNTSMHIGAESKQHASVAVPFLKQAWALKAPL